MSKNKKRKTKTNKIFLQSQPFPIHSMYIILRLPTNERKEKKTNDRQEKKRNELCRFIFWEVLIYDHIVVLLGCCCDLMLVCKGGVGIWDDN
jgi:hypothetical protein